MDSIKTGAFIKEKRKETGLTQKELAEILNCTDKAISRWETGKGFPEVTFLIPLSNVLNVSVNEILIGENIDMEKTVEKSNEIIVNTIKITDKKISNSRIILYVMAALTEIILSLVTAFTATPTDAMAVPLALILFSILPPFIIGFLKIKFPLKLIILPISAISFDISMVIYTDAMVNDAFLFLVYPLIIIAIELVQILIFTGISMIINKIKNK